MDRDELPHLARIAEQGVSGPLRSFPPYFSPRIWNTISTGKTPEKHGIHSFFNLDEDGRAHLLLSSDRRTHALWNIASEAGLRVAVVNWWNSFPPEKIDGIMVSDHAVPGAVRKRRELTGAAPVPDGSPVYPVAWRDRIDALFAEETPPVPFEDPFAANESLPHFVDAAFLSYVFDTDGALVRVALGIEAELHPDLLMILLPGIDRVSHSLWGNLEPAEEYPERLRPSPEERVAGREALYTYYRYTDALIGRLLARYGAEDLVIVLSDHGFESGFNKDQWVTGSHFGAEAGEGVLFARGRAIPHAPLDGRMTVRDVTPSILSWLGLPVARDMDGRPAPFLKAALVEPVETYDTAPIERLAAEAPQAEQEILENLRALGYFE